MTTEIKTTEVTVDVSSNKDFEKAIVTLNKQAKRLGVPEITIKYEGKVTRTRTIVHTIDGEVGEIRFPVEVDRYTVSRPVIKANGWKIVGSVTATEEGGRNFVERIDKEVDIDIAHYEKVPAGRCEHCNTSRSRKQTYIVSHEDGRLLQVGRQCLSELTHGCDVRVLEWQSVLCQFDCDGGEWGGGGGCGKIKTIKLKDALALTLAIAQDRGGWKDNQWKTDHYGERYLAVPGTHRLASHAIKCFDEPSSLLRNASSTHPYNYSKTFGNHLSNNLNYGQFAELYNSKVTEAEAIIDEIRNIDQDKLDDFGKEIHYLVSFDWIPVTKAGLSCYAPRWLQRKKEREEQDKVEALDVNEHIGEVGQRGTFHNLTLRRYKSWTSDQWGFCHLYVWADANGRKVVYIGSGDGGVTDIGTAVRFKATIKKQDERDGIKQTVVSRITDIHAYVDGEERGAGFDTKKTRKKK